MEPSFSSFSGYLMAILFLQIAALTSAVGMDIQMTVQIPDTGGFLIECNSGGWLPHTEVKWTDNKGNAIPHASKHFFQDGTGLFNLRMSVLLRNSTHGPVTCYFSNPVTGQEKRYLGLFVAQDGSLSQLKTLNFGSISCQGCLASFVPTFAVIQVSWLTIGVVELQCEYILFKSDYMHLMTNKISCPLTYLIGVFSLLCVTKSVICIKRSYVHLFDILLFEVFIVFLCVYFEFRRKVSALQELYPFYAVWTNEIWMILVALLSFFIIIIYLLLYSLNKGLVMLQTSELSPEIQEEHNRIIPENPGENILDQEL